MSELPLAITMGDAAGIGPETIAKVFRDGHAGHAIVIGCAIQMARAAAPFSGLRVVEISDPESAPPSSGIIPVIKVADLPADLPFGVSDPRAGRAAYQSVIHAADLALSGRVSAIVTAPLNKASMSAAGITLPGHTEILAERAGVADVAMMLANDELRVVLVSIHVSLKEAIQRVTTPSVLRTIRFAEIGARAFGIAHPRVAVAGLNPHAGEGGLFGSEDEVLIRPAVDAARAAGIDASGPWPPDTVFMQARDGRFDVVVAQYHDQGLIPVKYLGVAHGVNVTIGLPFVRTSPDHGTAFDIAGKGIADPSSLATAIRIARRMTSAA
jgi:4-hydroxythreonine-4-phosphate dehydrogenase